MIYAIKVSIVLLLWFFGGSWTLINRKCCDYVENFDATEDKCIPITSKMEYSKKYYEIMDCESEKTIFKQNNFVKFKLTDSGFVEFEFGESEMKLYPGEFCIDYDSRTGQEVAVLCDLVIFAKICCMEDEKFPCEQKIPSNLTDKIMENQELSDIRIHYVHQKIPQNQEKRKLSNEIFMILPNSTLWIRNNSEVLDDYCFLEDGIIITNLIKINKTVELKKLPKQIPTFTWVKISLGVLMIVIVSTYCITYYFPRMLLHTQES